MSTSPEEFEEFEEEPADLVEDTPDGGAVVTMMDQRADEEEVRNFYDNLVDQFDEPTLDTLAGDLLQKLEYDKKARERRIKEYADAIRRTGLGDEAPGGADFQGASKVVHPLLTEGAVDFCAQAIKELMPPSGPVKEYLPGDDLTKERADKSRRKVEFMNWQFKVQMRGFRSELEQLLTQNPLSGNGYIRLVFDHKRRRPVPIFVAIDDVLLPYAASNFYTAERMTYVENITSQEFESRIASGLYRALPTAADVKSSSQIPEQTEAGKATDRVEGREANAYNEDGLRTVYEVSCLVELKKGDGTPIEQGEDLGPVPYRISVDLTSRKVVAIVRNWDEDDPVRDPMHWMADFPFVPWRGAYAIGLNQMMAGIPASVTGALRALLDSAHVNNLPTLIRLKGANFSGQSTAMNVASVTELEGGTPGMDNDIRKLLMAVPFNPPSAVLFQLLGFLVDAGKGVVRTSFDNIGDIKPDMPVGTMLTMVEQGMKVMSSIHLRMYAAMDNVIAILHRINRMYLVEEDAKQAGAPPIHKSDFEGPLDAIPVADPQVFSDVQRFAQMQMVVQRGTQNPLYDQRKLEEFFLERTKIPNAKDLLVAAPKPTEMNQVNENVAMVMGRPVVAFPEQDHLAHIQVLLDFMTSPVLGQSPIVIPTFMPAALNHLKEHIVLWYVNQFYDMVKSNVQGFNLDDLMKDKDPGLRKELDQTLAAASPLVGKAAGEKFQQIPPIIQQAQQLIQQFAPPTVMDPSQATLQAAQIQAQSKAQSDQAALQRTQLQNQSKDNSERGKAQLKLVELQHTDQRSAEDRLADLQRETLRQENENQRTQAQIESTERINSDDNATALTIAGAEIQSSEKVAVSTGTGVNPNPQP